MSRHRLDTFVSTKPAVEEAVVESSLCQLYLFLFFSMDVLWQNFTWQSWALGALILFSLFAWPERRSLFMRQPIRMLAFSFFRQWRD